MQQVTVNRLELIGKLKANRAAHAEAHEKAMAGYDLAVREDVKRWREVMQRTEDRSISKEAVRSLSKFSTEPQHHLEEYDRALAMLEMSVEETITLQAHEFSQLVLDEWGWKRDFMKTSATYGAVR